jgi:uncharacterized protein (DUF427 family)
MHTESVWDYPRPPRVEPVSKRIQIIFNGVLLADTTAAKRVLETSHPPVYYIPPADLRREFLSPTEGGSWCEWKGEARYFDLAVGRKRVPRAAWTYPHPTAAFAAIKDHCAFYAGPLDACLVGGEKARPQPGGFYGGWITGEIAGPFKGSPGTELW